MGHPDVGIYCSGGRQAEENGMKKFGFQICLNFYPAPFPGL